MKIKILVFPVVLAISVTVFIAYTWPELGAVRETKSNLGESEKVWKNTLEKKNNLENLKNSLNQNQDKESFVLSYLPPDKSEERIINGISYLAANSGTSLTNLSLEEEKNVVSKGEEAPMDSKGALFSGSSTGDTSSPENQAAKPQIRFAKFKISIIGNYDNIRTFLEDLHRMEMFNSVDSVLIGKQEENKDQSQNPGVLYTTIEASFGYLPKTKISRDYSDPVFARSSFDFASYDKLKSLVSKKIPALEVKEQGRANPFLP